MSKNILYLLFFIAIVSGCNKKNDTQVFEKSPDERLNELLASYQSQLTGSQFGWKATLYTDSGRGTPYSFYFKFNDSNRVQMLSGFKEASAITFKESSYRLKALQQPSLLFDTYSYIHVLADPDNSVNGGGFGSGLSADFEFYFDSVSVDRITLGGRFHGNKLILIRATQLEATGYNNGQLAAGLSINKILTYFKRLAVGNLLLDVQISPVTQQVTFTYLDANGNLQTFTTNYVLVLGGIILTNPLVIGNFTISSLDNIFLNPATETITLTVNNLAATIAGIVVPLKVDIDAPQRWYDYALNNGNTYWISLNGFHVNGVDDAFGINALASGGNTYYYLIYWPQYDPTNDLFAPVYLNAAQTGLTLLYGSAPAMPAVTADGRAVFTELGTYGTYPATGAAAQTRALLYNSSGYYFVQTSATTYDMVSAANGKAWVTWEF